MNLEETNAEAEPVAAGFLPPEMPGTMPPQTFLVGVDEQTRHVPLHPERRWRPRCAGPLSSAERR